jgi:hypothetical protein
MNKNPSARQMLKGLLPYGLVRFLQNRKQAKSPAPPCGLEKLRNRHLGKRCFILATGPSINTQDLECLSNEVCIGASFFFLHQQIDKIRPAYHVLAPNHPPFGFELIEKYWNGLTGNYSWPCDVVWGTHGYRYGATAYFNQFPEKKRDNMLLLDFNPCPATSEEVIADWVHWDLCLKPFRPNTVVYMGIQLGWFMGCKEIYLLGCDHDYLNEVTRINNHFYQENKGNDRDSLHLAELDTEKWFHKYYGRWRDFRLMKTFLNQNGVEILNATPGGMLDVFPRVNFEELFR